MKTLLCRLALILAAASLAGCGLKGPLYFPKDQQTTPSTTTTTTTATSGSDAQAPATSTGQSAPAAK